MNSYDLGYPVLMVVMFFAGLVIISAYLNNHFRNH